MITRFAPSLTGYLHLGHVLHMLYVWGVAKSGGGKVICRIEDHDLSRRRPEYETTILENMEWLGFVPDLGMSASGAAEASEFRQSDCGECYERMLGLLSEQGLVYGCECSRKQIQKERSGADGELCYSGTCSAKGLPLIGNTVRLRVPVGEVVFRDLRLGECRQHPKQQCGDFSLRDRTGQWTYQFACVCDDIRQGVDLVIRGEDILASTARQIQLFQMLGHSAPDYFHHPLICDDRGDKLSKRQRSESISQLRDAGISAEEILGRAAYAGGLASDSASLSLSAALILVADRLR
ncbi:MAG: hypothetical protein JXR25_08790 [Pontiellaceae bacterium]|nr:hypothetical protein [Pontiellaceae bacterium]MBN2784911.1 hypothetical protein [Pontiellaceae bacterium]